ncbi:MAG: F0F1 ATP synthase subunit epsilon [Alphaproteobacteria bacterium]
MADKLHFSLVAPERELVNEDVDQVDVPGSEGEFGVLPNHAPVMSIVKPGALRVYNNGAIRKIFVNGGFADVTPAGLTILAEDAVDLADVDVAKLDQDIQNAREDVNGARDDAHLSPAQLRLHRLEAMKAALAR